MENKTQFQEEIHRWFEKSMEYDPQLNLKKISKLVKKKHKFRPQLKIKDGRIVISSRNRKCIHLESYYHNPDDYYNDLYFFIHNMKKDIVDKSARENYITFSFPNDEREHNMSIIHFVYNMIAWLPLFVLSIDINENIHLFMPKTFNNKAYLDYVDGIIERYKHFTTNNEMSKILAKMYDLFQRIADLYGLYLGISFSMYDIISRWDNQELYDINHVEVPKNYQIAEMEEFLTSQTKRFMEIYENETDNEHDSIKTMIRAGQMNLKQMREFMTSIGTKPDFNGDTYSHIPSPGANLTVYGLRNETDYVNDAVGGRKASILSLNIDEGGYLARVFCKSCSDIKLCPDPDYDCGSENYYICNISDKSTLKNMRGRWYLNEETNTLRQLIDTDYEMIGKTLKFRSPSTCAGGNKGICSTCYGHLYNQNLDIHVGINSALKLSESNYQKNMSAKHILDTKTNFIEFNKEFEEFFSFEDGFRVVIRSDIEDLDLYEIWLNVNCVYREKDIDDLNHNEYIEDFIIYDRDKKIKIEMAENEKTEMYLSKQLFTILKDRRKNREYNAKGWVRINLSELSPNEDLFFIRLKNDELTKPLRELKLLIEKGGEIGIPTVSELIDKLKYLMKCGGIETETIHIEILCRNLIRDKNNKINLPDWSIKDPEYIITSMHNSIFWSNSVVNSITFEKIKNQFKDPLTYKKRGTSFLDPCFILDYDKIGGKK